MATKKKTQKNRRIVTDVEADAQLPAKAESPPAASAPGQPPDLAHITESLRPLAVRLDSLAADPSNARQHDQRNLDAIKGSLRSFGQVKPLVVRRQTMTVVCGNGTLHAATVLGWEWVAANIIPMGDMTATRLAIADNRTSDLSEFDDAVLQELLASIKEDDPDLRKMLDDLKTSAPAATSDNEGESPITHAAITPEKLAELFHTTYERLAPKFGYEIRTASAVPWENVPDKTKRLMIAVCREILQALPAALPAHSKSA